MFLRTATLAAHNSASIAAAGAGSLCAAMAPSILRHRNSSAMASLEGSWVLPTVALVLLVSDALLDSTFHPVSGEAAR